MQKKQQQMEYLSIWTVIFVVFISTWSPIWNGDAVEKIALLYNFYPFLLSSGLLSLPLMQLRKLHDYITLITFSFYIFLLSIVCYHSHFHLVSFSFFFSFLDPQSEKGMQLRKLWRCSKRLTYPISSFGRKMWK